MVMESQEVLLQLSISAKERGKKKQDCTGLLKKSIKNVFAKNVPLAKQRPKERSQISSSL